MPDPIGKKESLKMLKYIFLIFGTSALIIVVVLSLAYSQYLSSPQKNFYMTFGGDLTFTDDSKSTWLIDNREDNHEKLLKVHWTGSPSEGTIGPQLKSSELVDQSGKKLDSNNVKFNDNPELTVDFIHGWNEIKVSLEDYSLPLGTFSGNIIVDGSASDSIPLIVSTQPLVIYAIALVVIGALLSVCVWEIIRYYKNKILNNEKPKVHEILGTDNNQTTMELTRQLVRNSSPHITIPKILLIELLSVLLGIAVALFGVLYNESVTSVQILGTYEVIVLVGIGLATGSLKELVDKVEWP